MKKKTKWSSSDKNIDFDYFDDFDDFDDDEIIIKINGKIYPTIEKRIEKINKKKTPID